MPVVPVNPCAPRLDDVERRRVRRLDDGEVGPAQRADTVKTKRAGSR